MFSFLAMPGDPGPVGRAGVGLGFTDRHGGVTPGAMGSLNLGRTDADDVENVARNGELLLHHLGAAAPPAAGLVAFHQVHGAGVAVVDEDFLDGWDERSWLGEAAGRAALPAVDGAVTRLCSVALLVRVADCVPVLLADPGAGVVGAAHAGRKGVDEGVLGATVRAMAELGATAIQAWIGPHVCGECYEVPQAMADEMGSRHPDVAGRTRWGSASLDLGVGCRHQLEALGVAVHDVARCTLTSPDLHSHRRDAALAGRGAGIIWRVSPATVGHATPPSG